MIFLFSNWSLWKLMHLVGGNIIYIWSWLMDELIWSWIYFQKQPSRGVLKKRSTENMQQIYRRTFMLKRDFNNFATLLKLLIRHGCSPVNLLHFFRTPFYKSIHGEVFLHSETCQTSNMKLVVSWRYEGV